MTQNVNDSDSATAPSEPQSQATSTAKPVEATTASDSVTAEGAPSSSSEEKAPSEQEKLEAEVARLRDQLMRTLADFDNFRKRSRKELADIERSAKEDQLREFLPIFDNLERASQHASTATDVKALGDGVQMVLKQFFDTLTRLGIERITALGQPFDPSLHEAVQQFETNDVAPGCIAAEIVAGYRAGDRLVRPAMVVVAKPKA